MEGATNVMAINSIFKKLKTTKLISTKNILTETGRVYIHGNRLNGTKFMPGAPFSIYFDEKNSKLTLVVDKKNGNYKVSKRKNSKGELTPIIDLKSDKVINLFKNSSISVDIYENVLIIYKAVEYLENKENIIDISKYINIKINNVEINLNKENNSSYIIKAVSGDNYPKQISLFDTIEPVSFKNELPDKHMEEVLKNPLITPEIKGKSIIKTVTSLFSGMGGLDYSFKVHNLTNTVKDKIKEKIKIWYKFNFAIDIDTHKELKNGHIETYKKNIGDHIVTGDILTYPISKIPKSNIVEGGIPCTELSSVSPKRNKFKLLPLFVDKFIEIVKYMGSECELFIIEESANIITAGKEFLDKIITELGKLFTITVNKVDAYDYGGFSHRKRAIIIGSKIGKIELAPPALKELKTVRMAFQGLDDSIPNQTDVTIPKQATIEKFKLIEAGSNNKSLPDEMKNKGEYSNNCKRLSYDEPSIAICNPRKSNILHPSFNRILSVRECLRLMDFPDSFVMSENCSLASKQEAVANAVPFSIGKAIVSAVTEAYMKVSNSLGLLT